MFAHGLVKELIDQKVYQTIHQALLEDYPDQKVKTDCLIYYYKERKLTDEFYTFDIILNPSKPENLIFTIDLIYECSFYLFEIKILFKEEFINFNFIRLASDKAKMFFKIINKLFFVQMITFIQCGFLKVFPDEAVYETINAMLKNQISNDTKLYECIVVHFEKNDIADNLPTFYDQNKLSTVIQPYIDEAKSSFCANMPCKQIKQENTEMSEIVCVHT
ncbi:unnamed protein product [Chironomus riparius]|uniref:Uncharacterized protein n=1 Tax=Chironomus riparius TaxID=315576 RepID=A0A9N9WXW6_9DIPT|nr:unnamed protein product [Chironomus riparius]